MDLHYKCLVFGTTEELQEFLEKTNRLHPYIDTRAVGGENFDPKKHALEIQLISYDPDEGPITNKAIHFVVHEVLSDNVKLDNIVTPEDLFLQATYFNAIFSVYGNTAAMEQISNYSKLLNQYLKYGSRYSVI